MVRGLLGRAALRFAPVTPCCARVVRVAGDELNADLARRFKVDTKDLPKYALFRKGGEDVL